MGLWIVRLFGLGASLISGGLIYYNWQRLLADHSYSFRIASLAPIGVVMGLYILVFPTKIGKPETTLDKLMAVLIVVIGAAAGAYNWYLMDPEKFSFLIK